jgi:hypothetical protein
VLGVTYGTSAIDPAARRMFFVGPTLGGYSLVVVDLTTGSTTAYPLSGIGLSIGFLVFLPAVAVAVTVTGGLGSVLLLVGLALAGYALIRAR